MNGLQGGPPPAPNPDAGPNDMPQNALLGSAPPGAGALSTGPGGPAAGGPAAQQGPAGPGMPAPPTHQQTMTALRHFSAIEKELETLLKNPDLGKSDIRSNIIDGTSKLVGMGIMTAPQAVNELGNVPDKPFDQKQWVEGHYKNAINAGMQIMEMHRQGFQGHGPHDDPDPANHTADMAGLHAGLQGQN